MSPSASLAAAAIAWVAFHIGVSGTGLRRVLVSRIGEGPFRGLFVLASIALLYWLGTAYGSAGPIALLWQAPRWLVVAGMWLLLPATLLLVCSLSQPNPTSVRGKRALEAEEPAVGILRITRHPMLWAFALWAVVHLVALGTVAAAWLAGAILVTALAFAVLGAVACVMCASALCCCVSCSTLYLPRRFRPTPAATGCACSRS